MISNFMKTKGRKLTILFFFFLYFKNYFLKINNFQTVDLFYIFSLKLRFFFLIYDRLKLKK